MQKPLIYGEWITHIQFISWMLQFEFSRFWNYRYFFCLISSNKNKKRSIYLVIFWISWLLKFKIQAKSYHSACPSVWFYQFFSPAFFLDSVILQTIYWKRIANCQTAVQSTVDVKKIMFFLARFNISKRFYGLCLWAPGSLINIF